MASGILESREITLQKLDDEIQSLINQFQLLKSHRNTFSITYSLPPEVLSEIFAIQKAICQEIPSRWDSLDKPYYRFQLWLGVTHVSKYWRQVALGSPSFWCDIDIEAIPPSAIPPFLIRSTGRNISVNVESYGEPDCDFTTPQALLPQIFAESFRIQELTIIGTEAFTEVLPHLKADSIQQLTKLTISGEVYVPDDIFQGTPPPQLTALHLESCKISSKSPLFMNNLTTLAVSCCDTGLTTVDWLRMLQHLPRLSCFSWETPGDEYVLIPEDFGVVSLHHLTSLTIDGISLKNDLAFLSHILFPYTTRFKFRSREIDGSNSFGTNTTPPSALELFMQVHNQSRQNLSKMQITRLEIWDTSNTSLKFVISPQSDHESELYAYLDVQIYKSQYCPTPLLNETQMTALSSLPISNTTSLAIDIDVNKEILEFLSNYLPNLHKISCGKKAAEGFLVALAATTSEEVEQVSQRVNRNDSAESPPDHWPTPELFKSLEVIHMEAISIHKTIHIIQDALRARQRSGYPIKELRFIICNGHPEEYTPQLENLVDVIEFDFWGPRRKRWYQWIGREDSIEGLCN